MTKFTIQRGVLLTALSAVSKAVPTRGLVPITENFLFETGQISASNMAVFMTAKCPIECEAVAIPSKVFDIIKALREQPVTFELSDGRCVIRTASGKFELPTEPGSDFPRMAMADTKECRIDGLSDLLDNVSFAIANDYLSPALSALHIEFGDHVTVTATNAHQLSTFHTTGYGEGALLIPGDMIRYIPTDPSITYTDKNMTFVSGEVSVTIRLSEEKYPDYKGVLPKSQNKHLTVNLAEFSGAVRRVLLMGNEASNQVRLACGIEIIEVSAENIDYAKSGLETVSGTHDGEPIFIGFNGKMMLEILAKCDGESVTLDMTTHDRAITIVQQNGMFLLMPIMLEG